MAAAGDNNHNHNSSHDNNYDIDPPAPLIDPSLLAGLSESDRKEALAAAAAAQRAEERAEQRALERALTRKEEERRREREVEEERQEQRLLQKQQQQRQGALSGEEDAAPSLVYVPKRRRLVGDPHTHSSDRNEGGEAEQTNRHESSRSSNGSSANATTTGLKHPNLGNGRRGGGSTGRSKHEETVAAAAAPVLSEREAEYVRKAYLGKSSGLLDAGSAPADASDAKSRRKDVRSKKPTFKFRWDNTDDTAVDDDPLYGSIPAVHNRGAASTAATFQPPTRAYSSQHPPRGGGRGRSGRSGPPLPPPASSAAMDTVLTKPLGAMTSRDWRIFRENYEINVRGGKAPSPLRAFRESNPPLHELIVQALERDLKFREPTPIQRQAIPIGLQRRDLIGLAETGSGKTVAFGVPLCHYLLNLPSGVLDSVAQQGPLAVVLAPTRELALQIQTEFSRLLNRCQHLVRSCAVVGGQSIQQQSQQLRNGVHIVVGTPGRLNEVLDLAYLVLNQCSYVVLDEADRMLDMGFAPQISTILDAMGGTLKSENEEEAYQQELEDVRNMAAGVARHRVTAMFSATMPLDVQVMAQKYLRHPAIVSIGDRDTVKNSRITQKLVWTVPGQKERVLLNLLGDPRFLREKVLVFVNEKKHADGVGRVVERSGRDVVVMHGGKSQEQREDHLERFRRGGVVMVATDVAGRGLDIPDVAHVINFDLPTRSIENYTHRIGRTGRAGKQGVATSIITDEDEGIMAALRQYLESTGNEVPERLARHPAAASGSVHNLID